MHRSLQRSGLVGDPCDHDRRVHDACRAAPFTANDLVIYRVGTGQGTLSSAANPVFLDEFDQSGAFVQTVAMPTAANGSNRTLTASGTATSEGELTLSADGSYLMLTGYDAAVGTASVAGTASATTNRVVGRVDANGVVDTSTALNDFSTGNNPRSATSTDGTDIWVGGGAGGVRKTTLGTVGSSTQLSTTVTNIRQVNIVDNQLYASDASGSTNQLGRSAREPRRRRARRSRTSPASRPQPGVRTATPSST